MSTIRTSGPGGLPGDDDPERHLPPHHQPLPELDDAHRAAISPEAYLEVQASPEFADLRNRFRRFAFPLTIAFLAWYFLYVLLSVYASHFMATRIGNSNITIGLLLGLLQFVTTFAITALYIRHANRTLDPLAAKLRDRLEEGVR